MKRIFKKDQVVLPDDIHPVLIILIARAEQLIRDGMTVSLIRPQVTGRCVDHQIEFVRQTETLENRQQEIDTLPVILCGKSTDGIPRHDCFLSVFAAFPSQGAESHCGLRPHPRRHGSWHTRMYSGKSLRTGFV